MGDISETPSWHDKIYQIERRDRVSGGRGGIANRQAEQLASRTQYLKSRLESVSESKEYTFYISEEDPDGTISGIAVTSSGQTFRVAQGVSSDYSFIYYLNNGGVALPISRVLGASAVERRLPEYNQLPGLVAAFVDD
ncbi:TPA: SGNH/GDSL hydrolase family protein, partial [Klebsiella pneumoniae]